MEMQISFSMDNAAFDGDALAEGVAFALRCVQRGVDRGDIDGDIRDTNGNTVGAWAIANDDDAERENTRAAIVAGMRELLNQTSEPEDRATMVAAIDALAESGR